jgi:hypothetical protein
MIKEQMKNYVIHVFSLKNILDEKEKFKVALKGT